MEDTRGNVRVSWHLNLVYSVSWCIYIYIYIFTIRIQAYREAYCISFLIVQSSVRMLSNVKCEREFRSSSVSN